MGLESLSPNRRSQYEALLPEIERSVRNTQNARGGFYSGEATDAETRAKADLLAKLAAQDAAEQATSNENARDRALTERIKNEEIKAGKRNSLLNILGTGVGAATTLGGLKYMNPAGGSNVITMNGRLFEKGAKGAWVDVTPGAGGAPTAASGRAPVDMVASPGGGNLFEPAGWNSDVAPGSVFGGGAPTSPGGVPTSPVPTAPAAAGASMWKNAIVPTNLGAGALGGGLGYLGARAAGANGKNADIGSAVGGAGGYMGGLALANKFGWSNPWSAGLGALLGAGGGGLLDNLFK